MAKGAAARTDRRLRLRRSLASLAKVWLQPAALIGTVVFLIVAIVGIAAPNIAPFEPGALAMRNRFAPPGDVNLFGTDHLGRDLFSRVVYGTRISMYVGAMVTLIACTGGVLIGLIGGYHRRVGNILMRVVDGLLALPGIILALALIAVFGAKITNVILALGFVFIPRVARVVHGVVLELKARDFISAAQALGASDLRVILGHLLPNAFGPVIVQASFIFANAVISEAGLSFLGVGVPAGTPTWGSILSEGRLYMQNAPWITLFPGLAIFITVLSLNLVGDAIRDQLDPRMR
jgi:peptide/nickel transport system permease protein